MADLGKPKKDFGAKAVKYYNTINGISHPPALVFL